MWEADEGVGLDIFTAAALGLSLPPLSIGDINNKNNGGWTMLMYACYYNKGDIVSLLVSLGADKTIQCRKGRTAMMIAAINGNVDILGMVYEDIIVNLTDFYGMTALGLAIEHGHKNTVEFLLSKNADPDVYLEKGTCLMSAAASGQYLIVQLLLRHKADLTIKNHLGQTAKDLADKNGQTEIAKLIGTYEEADIGNILNFLGLEEYLSLFKHENINFKTFLYLTEEEMKEIGITIFGRRRRLALFLKDIRECYEGLF